MYRRHYAPSTTNDDEWEIFLETCRAYKVSPIRRQIYLIGRWNNEKKRVTNVPQISIGALRLMALRTREFEGTTEPQWGDEEGNWYTCWPKAKGKHPYAARVGIYRKGFRAPVWGIVYFHEVAQKKRDGSLTQFWQDSGLHQLAKCAEADGIRKAFEEECGGIYLHEEMLQADTDNPVVSIIPEVDVVDADTNEALKQTASTKRSEAPSTAQSSSNGNHAADTAMPANGATKPLTWTMLYNPGKKAGKWKDTEEFTKFVAKMLKRPVEYHDLNELAQHELTALQAAMQQAA
jgi:phage recombination protein Bet